MEGERGQPGGHEQSERGTDKGENSHREENALATDTQRGESDDLAVHGHASEAEKDTDENAHGDGENEKAGNDTEEEKNDLRTGAGMADEELHETDELGNEEDERENEKAEEGVAGDFAGDIAIEKTHGEKGKGQCNMGEKECGVEVESRYL